MPDYRYKNGYSAHPIHFESFRRYIASHGVAEMHSISLIYAQLRNARRIIGPLESLLSPRYEPSSASAQSTGQTAVQEVRSGGS